MRFIVMGEPVLATWFMHFALSTFPKLTMLLAVVEKQAASATPSFIHCFN